jgi:hypothetical protein
MGLALDKSEPPPTPIPPPGGWRKPTCTFASHSWELEVEGGRANLTCKDPCDPALFDPARLEPLCLFPWEPEDLVMDIPVTVTHVDDSTPSTPAGPAEYGFYLEIRPCPA